MLRYLKKGKIYYLKQFSPCLNHDGIRTVIVITNKHELSKFENLVYSYGNNAWNENVFVTFACN